MKRVLLVAVVAAFPLLSCSNATGPVATVSATVTRLTMGAPGSLDATLDVEMTNETSYAIYLAACAMSLERQNVDGVWDQVWSIACPSLTSGWPLFIPAGESRLVPVRITAQANGVNWPSAGLEGIYRLRVAFFPDWGVARRMLSVSNELVAQPVVSNEFAFPTP